VVVREPGQDETPGGALVVRLLVRQDAVHVLDETGPSHHVRRVIRLDIPLRGAASGQPVEQSAGETAAYAIRRLISTGVPSGLSGLKQVEGRRARTAGQRVESESVDPE
jgi:hypothetical protein